MEISSRHHLRNDEVRDLEAALEAALGVSLDGDTYELVSLADSPFDLVLVDGDPSVFYYEDEPFLTVRGANENPPRQGIVTVDAGAVSFVSDGADVMRPGIVEADETISEDDLVAKADEVSADGVDPRDDAFSRISFGHGIRLGAARVGVSAG